MLIVETSSMIEDDAARRFYERAAFVRKARLREFCGPGKDKIVSWKSLLRPIPDLANERVGHGLPTRAPVIARVRPRSDTVVR